MVMVFNATFNNISVTIVVVSFIGGGRYRIEPDKKVKTVQKLYD